MEKKPLHTKGGKSKTNTSRVKPEFSALLKGKEFKEVL